MGNFDIDRYLDSQTNKYLDSLEMGRDEIERMSMERDAKMQALAEEFMDMVADLNKEYKDLDPLTAKEICNEYL